MSRGGGLAFGALLGLAGCHDVTSFSNSGDHYEGPIVAGDFVRTGLGSGTTICVVIDANHLQDAPGVVSSSDGRFQETPLRPIPQIWHDPLSTLSFGEGRVQNLVYVATPSLDADTGGDVMVIVSLMQSGGIEVRLLRGAPVAGVASASNLFGVFSLSRAAGPCSF